MGARLQRAAFKDALLVGFLFFAEFHFYPIQFSQFQDNFVTPVLLYLTIGALHEFTMNVRPAKLLRDAFLSLCIQPAAVGYPSVMMYPSYKAPPCCLPLGSIKSSAACERPSSQC